MFTSALSSAKSRFLASSLIALASSGCGILIGNVKPVAEKSDDYSVMELSKTDPEWQKIEVEPAKPTNESVERTEIPDVAFQSRKTHSIISLNSTCRPSHESMTDLKLLSQEPLLGITSITDRKERDIQVDGEPAIEITLRGRIDTKETMLRSVLAKKRTCVYDLLFVARPKHFTEDEAIFTGFVTSLRFPKR